MLCLNSYKQDYIDECRSRMESHLAACKTLLTTARAKAGAGNTAIDTAVASFEPLFSNNLVAVLDGFFVHRSRTLEGKDGNPLNEFRMICTSLLQNHGVMCMDKTNNKTIKYSPEKAVVKLKIGDEIELTESFFVAHFKAFFAEIEAKFV